MDIQRILEENQRAIEGEKRAEFERFRSLLLNYNEKYNLTAITEEKDVFYKHFLDSSAGSGVFKRGASVAEIVSLCRPEAFEGGFILYFVGKRGEKV